MCTKSCPVLSCGCSGELWWRVKSREPCGKTINPERETTKTEKCDAREGEECSPAPRRVGEWCRVCGARWRERSGGEGERRCVRTGWAGSTTRRAATGESTHAVRRECGLARPPPVRGALSEARRRALPSRPCPTGLPLGGGKVQVKETRSKQPTAQARE